ncbi:sporulation protein YunB [Fervidibacillus halotolerans]|uniref:Sporulation protein YunB n=1 Tax=Fervidibacillus halotolerans TaxID=2980027 RepID=A0A9E8LYH7_9BACI|nr:sporulation protein YunB [Fervidibacillus halotolerans]WAA11901.1 sporulation protein YunB [Fervidibacillus halotolerans]
MQKIHRGHLRRKRPLPFRYVLLLTTVLFLLFSALGLWIVNIAIKPVLVAYAESRSVNIATYVMNKAVKEEIGEGLPLNEITVVKELDESTLYTIDTQKIIELSNNIANRVLNHINAMEEGDFSSSDHIILSDEEIEKVEVRRGEGIQFNVPLGRITDNVLLGSLGPEIPVRFHAIGDIDYDIETLWQEQAINSTWFEIRMKMKVGIQIVIPFMTKMTVIERTIPLATGTIKGDVPQFYSNGGGLTPSFTIPMDPEKDESNQ